MKFKREYSPDRAGILEMKWRDKGDSRRDVLINTEVDAPKKKYRII